MMGATRCSIIFLLALKRENLKAIYEAHHSFSKQSLFDRKVQGNKSIIIELFQV